MASTREYGGQGDPVGAQTLGELVATATRDLSLLVHHEIDLAKAELAEEAKKAAVGAGLAAGAAAFALLGLLMVCFAGGFGIAAAADIPVWAGFLCVTGVFVVVGGVLGFVGVRAFTKINGPEQTVSTVKEGLASLRHRRG
ncbi:MAG TPA: phage holin family protein [Mycobacteriales bacterium]|nr:phage holin family protein [Mycobacteriales bacterium]